MQYSVIIPVFNGERIIRRCLDALATQTVDNELYEVIVVDDGSTDNTAAVVEDWLADHPKIHTKLCWQANAGPAAARNYGARIAKTEILLFTDADCAPCPHWIECLAKPLHDGRIVGAKGTYLTEQRELVAQFVQTEYEDRYQRMHQLETIDFIDTYAAAYRRTVFLENDGFSTAYPTASVEDQEFSFRLAAQGHPMVFVPDAQVVHFHNQTIGAYARRKFLIGYWKALLLRAHPSKMVQDSHTPQRLKLQIALTAIGLVLLPMILLSAIWQLNVSMALSIVLLMLVVLFFLTELPFMRTLTQRSWRLGLISPVLLLTRSVSLGTGLLIGFFRFRL
ncbi:MAG: glycosyltransferase [Chloroflexota bacterium]